jgi:hypothetical protein
VRSRNSSSAAILRTSAWKCERSASATEVQEHSAFRIEAQLSSKADTVPLQSFGEQTVGGQSRNRVAKPRPDKQAFAGNDWHPPDNPVSVDRHI